MKRMMHIFTTAFSVVIMAMLTARADLPEGYTRLPYLYLNGNCQVRTDFTLDVTDKVVMTWCTKSVSGGNECLWCTRKSGSSMMLTMFMFKTKIGLYYNNVGYTVGDAHDNFTVNSRVDLEALTKYTIVADYNAKTCVITNNFTGAETMNCSWTVSGDFTAGSKLGLFASHVGDLSSSIGNCGRYFVYSFQVYGADGKLKMDLVPVKNPSSTVGLYDTVSGNFLVDSTSGTLDDTLIDKSFSFDCTLQSDETFGSLTVESGKSINMNGHNLYVSSLAGEGTVFSVTSDLTDPDSARVSSDTILASSTRAANLFNNNYSHSGEIVDGVCTGRVVVLKKDLPLVVDYDFGEGSEQVVDAYKVWISKNAYTYQQRAPGDWTFQGSHDKVAWTILDERARQVEWLGSPNECRVYTFANTTAYRYYRISFTSSSKTGVDALDLLQLEYLHAEPTYSELHIDCDGDLTLGETLIEGNVKIVKNGVGTLTMAKNGQLFYGGIDVREGTVKTEYSGNDRSMGLKPETIRVEAGGVLDMCGHADYACSIVTLNGGTVSNSGSSLGSSYKMIGNVAVESDSTFAFNNSYGMSQYYDSDTPIIELGGNTLSVQISTNKTFTLKNAVVRDGTVDVTGGGIMSLCGTGVVATNADFILDCALDVKVPFSVRNYAAKYAADGNSGTAALNVYGTFKPASHDYFYGCTMQDCSMIDFSERTEELPLESAFTTGDNTLKFAEEATVTITGVDDGPLLGQRIIRWDAAPANVTFVSTDDLLKVKSRSDGLYCYFRTGLAIFIW